MKNFVLLGLLLTAGSAFANPCNDLKSCAKVMTEVTGQRYVWDTGTEKEKIVTSSDIDLTKENAEIVFTGMLDQLGLARMPMGDGKTFRVMRGAERKETEMPIVEASADHMPAFGNTWDWVTMRYKTKSREMPSIIEQMYRLHVPREGRLQADNNAGLIIVSGATPVVRQMYNVIRAADVIPSAAAKKEAADRERRWQEQYKNEKK